ncbi:hypothetical protein DFP72DRAFT_1064889 [Ephemerocybe angulata]|uniref:Zn(2)-C6 fungal-type domain-containing protein n=1 Tax=Ephemerocybe angulata TaxID=980116 RepID=A0A8H6M705_9AGAR|nr:hypothetical protein DFP72DRAFT_1064889 [Tulosesus angulatus]
MLRVLDSQDVGFKTMIVENVRNRFRLMCDQCRDSLHPCTGLKGYRKCTFCTREAGICSWSRPTDEIPPIAFREEDVPLIVPSSKPSRDIDTDSSTLADDSEDDMYLTDESSEDGLDSVPDDAAARSERHEEWELAFASYAPLWVSDRATLASSVGDEGGALLTLTGDVAIPGMYNDDEPITSESLESLFAGLEDHRLLDSVSSGIPDELHDELSTDQRFGLSPPLAFGVPNFDVSSSVHGHPGDLCSPSIVPTAFDPLPCISWPSGSQTPRPFDEDVMHPNSMQPELHVASISHDGLVPTSLYANGSDFGFNEGFYGLPLGGEDSIDPARFIELFDKEISEQLTWDSSRVLGVRDVVPAEPDLLQRAYEDGGPYWSTIEDEWLNDSYFVSAPLNDGNVFVPRSFCLLPKSTGYVIPKIKGWVSMEGLVAALGVDRMHNVFDVVPVSNSKARFELAGDPPKNEEAEQIENTTKKASALLDEG